MLLLEGLSNFYKIRFLIHKKDDYSKTWRVWNTSLRENYQDGWPDSCCGNNQSPIELLKKTAEIVHMSRLVYTNYDVPQDVFLENNGHTVKVGFGCKSVSICDGILENEYVLDNIHFHWNSEHTLNGKKYPLESHFVHYIKEAENLQNALNIPFGIAIIAVFYEFSPEGSEIFNKITKNVECVATNIKEPVPLDEQLVPKELLPKRSCNYYAYTGSLTTPDCNEPVQWIIFPKPCKISPCQLEALKNIYDEDNKPILRNARPLQPLNGRIVKYVKESFYGKFKKK